jgi:hypothetical protein
VWRQVKMPSAKMPSAKSHLQKCGLQKFPICKIAVCKNDLEENRALLRTILSHLVFTLQVMTLLDSSEKPRYS